MPEVYHFAVAHYVFLAFQSKLGARTSFGESAGGHQIVIGDHFGADEAFLNVAVNLAGRLQRRATCSNGPCAALVLADSEERDQVEQAVTAADEARHRRLLQAVAFQKL